MTHVKGSAYTFQPIHAILMQKDIYRMFKKDFNIIWPLTNQQTDRQMDRTAAVRMRMRAAG